MKPQVSGVRYLSEKDAGSRWEYTFVFLDADPNSALRQLLEALVPGHQMLLPDPMPGDCYLEARRTQHGFETKRGCHGAYGTWHEASIEEAHRWLLPGAQHAMLQMSNHGTLDFPKPSRAA
jgi:hypothetical protein